MAHHASVQVFVTLKTLKDSLSPQRDGPKHLVTCILPTGFFPSFIWRYCWWFRNPVNQLRLVGYPIIYRVLYISGGCFGFLPSTVFGDSGGSPHIPGYKQRSISTSPMGWRSDTWCVDLKGGLHTYYPRICPLRLEQNPLKIMAGATRQRSEIKNDGISKFVLDPNWETNDGSIPIEWVFNLMDPIFMASILF